jgi:hypothetical protein
VMTPKTASDQAFRDADRAQSESDSDGFGGARNRPASARVTGA